MKAKLLFMRFGRTRTMQVLLILIVSLFLGIDAKCQKQKTIDSLEKLLISAREDTFRVKLLNTITNKIIDIDYDKSLMYETEAVDLAIKLDYKGGLAFAYDNIGTIKYKRGSYKEAMDYSLKALSLFREIKDMVGIAISLTGIANVHLDQGNYDSALFYQFKSLDIYKQLGDKGGMAVNYNDIGLIYLQKSEFKSAFDYFMKQLYLEEERGNKAGISDAFSNLGNIYFEQQAFDKAIEYHGKSRDIKAELNDRQGVGYSLNNIGNANVQKGEYKTALKYYYDALEILEDIDNKKGVVTVLDNIGAVYYFQQKYPEAIKLFLKSKAVSEECGNKMAVAISLVNIGEVKLNMKEYAEAIKFYEDGVKIAKAIDVRGLVRDGTKGISDAYVGMGDYNNAYNAYRLFSEVKDTILNEVSAKNINELQIKYETEKKDKENILLKKDKVINEANLAKQRNQKIIFAISGLLILVVAVFIIIFWRKSAILAKEKERVFETESSLTEFKVKSKLHNLASNFNTMNFLLRENRIDESKEFTDKLGIYYNLSKEYWNKIDYTIQDEIDILHTYSDVLRQYKSDIEIVVNNPDQLSFEKIAFMNNVLDTLLDNTVFYGYPNQDRKCVFAITIQKINGYWIRVTVKDNGDPQAIENYISEKKKEKGLYLLRERIRNKAKRAGIDYGDVFVIEPVIGIGTIVHIVFPFKNIENEATI